MQKTPGLMNHLAKAAAAMLVLGTLVTGAAKADEYRPVVIIQMDSLRADHIQPYGYGRATSPNIAAFAKNATTFETTYPAASWTRPSILSTLTGRYSSELTTNIGGSAPIKDGQPTIATTLRSYGYTTAAFYNTAQLKPEIANVQSGFDHFEDYGHREDKTRAYVSEGVDKAIAFLSGAKKPPFVYLHILNPHHPYLPRQNVFGQTPVDKFRDSYTFATGVPPYDPNKVEPCYVAKDLTVIPEMMELYDSEIHMLDAEVGRLLGFIEGDARLKNALVIITSDHGEEFGEHGGLYHGARFYEESLRVPLIIRDPTRPYGIGRRVTSIVSLIDLAPTILSMVGVPFKSTDYSGSSLLPYFTRRGGLQRDTVYIERPGCGYDATVAVRKAQWKMIVRITRPKVELYDLSTDPAEKHDLSDSKSAAARRARVELSALFDNWYRQVNRPLPTRNGDSTAALPDELRERLKALGYVQ